MLHLVCTGASVQLVVGKSELRIGVFVSIMPHVSPERQIDQVMCVAKYYHKNDGVKLLLSKRRLNLHR
jgi:hypothetical protein